MPPTHQTKWVAGDYFAALGVPVLAGRNLEWADLHARARRLVVNEAFARAHSANARAAVGKRVRPGPAGSGGRSSEWSATSAIAATTNRRRPWPTTRSSSRRSTRRAATPS